jgi:hypothetical protein
MLVNSSEYFNRISEAPAFVIQLVAKKSMSDDSVSDFSLLSTPENLILAFGQYSGLEQSWFTDTSKQSNSFKAARKHKGGRGRGAAKPLYCPYEVMCALLNPKRKRGKRIQPLTAWRALRRMFPLVFELHKHKAPTALREE